MDEAAQCFNYITITRVETSHYNSMFQHACVKVFNTEQGIENRCFDILFSREKSIQLADLKMCMVYTFIQIGGNVSIYDFK